MIFATFVLAGFVGFALYKNHELKMVVAPVTTDSTTKPVVRTVATGTTVVPPSTATLTPVAPDPATNNLGPAQMIINTPVTTPQVVTAVTSDNAPPAGTMLTASSIGAFLTIGPTGHIAMSAGIPVQLKVNGNLHYYGVRVDEDAPTWMQGAGTWVWTVFIPGQQDAILQSIYTVQPSTAVPSVAGAIPLTSSSANYVPQVIPPTSPVSQDSSANQRELALTRNGSNGMAPSTPSSGGASIIVPTPVVIPVGLGSGGPAVGTVALNPTGIQPGTYGADNVYVNGYQVQSKLTLAGSGATPPPSVADGAVWWAAQVGLDGKPNGQYNYGFTLPTGPNGAALAFIY